MENTLSLLIKLIYSALTNSVLPDGFLLPSKSAEKVFLLSAKQDLAHLVSFGLYKNNISQVEPELKKKLLNSQAAAVIRYEQQNFELHRVCNLFEKNGIKALPLKGAVIRPLYPEEWMRTSCDIDILVDEADCEKAVALLLDKAEYTYKSKGFHDYKLASKSGVNLELHYDLIEEREVPTVAQKIKEVWQNSKPNKGEKFIYSMTNEFFVFYHIAHMAKHFKLGGCGIRPFIDLWLLNQKTQYNKKDLEDVLKDTGLLEFFNAASLLADVWFSKKQHTELTKTMEQYIISGGIYGSFDNNIAISKGSGKTKTRYFLKMLFLPKKNLELLYPKLQSRPVLLPYYQVKRWFKLLDKEKREKLRKINSVNDRLSSEKISSIKELFDKLNIK